MTDTTEEEIKKELDSLITCPYCRKILKIYEFDKCRCINPECKLRKDYSIPIYDYGFFEGKLEGYKLGKAQARKKIIEQINNCIYTIKCTSGYCGIGEWLEEKDLLLFQSAIDRLEVQLKQIENGDKT